MPCYSPMTAFQCVGTGEIFFREMKDSRELKLPCGHCTGCYLERSRQWAVRCMHEASMYEHNSFITLTYNQEHLPPDCSLDYSHFQLFMKRLRFRHYQNFCKSEDFARGRDYVPVRFYMCGEYGSKNFRPHYHACLFNVSFGDREYFRMTDSGHKSYVSESLNSLWSDEEGPIGHAEIGEVTFESAGYVARYCLKKVGTRSEDEYRVVDKDTGEVYNRIPEFTRMSLKPGIGQPWFERYKAEVFPLDRVVVRGVEAKPPKYYKTLLERSGSMDLDKVEWKRYLDGVARADDNTEARLKVKEAVQLARIKALKRSGT